MKVGDKVLLENKVVEITELKWNMAKVKYLHAWSWVPISELKPIIEKK